jgi:hypothetical protein
MLNSNIGTIILDGLFGMYTEPTKNIAFSGDLYLGFLTELPNDNGDAHADGTYFSEPDDPSYLRIKMNTKSRITKEDFIGGAAWEEIDTDIEAICVKNQSLIMFPEFTTPCNIVGFGIFRNNDVGDQTLPILWGEVFSEDGTTGVEIEPEEVPIIRAGGFRVSLM